MTQAKNIVMGVSGGIAVYKAIEVASSLTKAGCSVHVIMTDAAAKFVTPLTFREITANPVVVGMWEEPKTWNVEHIALASLADVFAIVPATANIIGKIANGIADDMLSTTVMATKAPVVLAPAMNTNMYLNPVLQENLAKLAKLGYNIIPPESGRLACGVEGPGRLAQPAVIVDKLLSYLDHKKDLQQKKILITAGGTREPIDPVRYISNRSSGKMGYAIAKAAFERGAEVTLVTGPTVLAAPAGVKVIAIETAEQMRTAVLAEFSRTDIVIKAAAVADYRPAEAAAQKIKKNNDTLTLVLQKNPDILKELGNLKKTNQLLIGFAAETHELLTYARQKLLHKNLDMIVANDVTAPGAGFNSDTNIVKLLYRNGSPEELPQMPKDKLAHVLLDRICRLM